MEIVNEEWVKLGAEPYESLFKYNDFSLFFVLLYIEGKNFFVKE